jgi:hypothetical protein
MQTVECGNQSLLDCHCVRGRGQAEGLDDHSVAVAVDVCEE